MIYDDGKLLARYDGLCIKRQCNMYRVRPTSRHSKEEIKRYRKILKVRLEERFLKGPDYAFDVRLKKDHLLRGVWICLNHFTGVTPSQFLETLAMPESASLKKETGKKSLVQIRLSALPPLGPSGISLKTERPCEEEEEDEVTEVSGQIQGAYIGEGEVQVVYVSPKIGENYKLNRRRYSRHSWSRLEKIPELTVAACEFFGTRELCLPSIVDRYLEIAGRENGRILGLSSLVFEAALRKDSSRDLANHLDGLSYSSSLTHVLLPYYFFGRWSLVVYDLEKTRVDNYVLSPNYDWKVSLKLEQILYSLQDKLMLRRTGIAAKNTFQNFSRDHDSQFGSGAKVLTLVRDLAQGLDPKEGFWKDSEVVRAELAYFDSIFGHFVKEDHVPLVQTATSSDLANTRLTDAGAYNLFARK